MSLFANRRIRQLLILVCCMSALAFGSAFRSAFAGDSRNAKLATANWLPYTGDTLPKSGAISLIVQQALQQQNITAVVGVWPWGLAVDKAAAGANGIIGYYPGYHCHHHATKKFVATEVISQSILGFVFHKGKRLKRWKTLSDLKGKKIGYVNGYASTPEFAALEKSGLLTVLRNDSDIDNLRLLARGQIDLVLIDEFVFEYLMAKEDQLSLFKKKFHFHNKPVAAKNLYLCLRKTPAGLKLKKAFNTGLQKLDVETILSRYFSEVF
jgi:polar amino acid transport system substrate-binding protein